METQEQAQETIWKELTSDDAEVRAEYMQLFAADAQEFAKLMAEAFIKWRALDNDVAKADEARAHVSALVHTAITLHILSMKLFLSGQTIAAGNLMRQVVDSIAIALLCSGGKALPVLEAFMADRYSSSVAVRDVVNQAKKLALKADALDVLKDARDFYHQYSHPTKATIAIGMSFSEHSALYVGASFDKGKVDAYEKEMQGRVSLAKVFANFVDGVTANVAKW